MTDIRADGPTPLDNDDKLPWLEAVDDDDDRDGPSAAKLIAFVVIGLVAIGLIVGGLFWMGSRDDAAPAEGEPELIAAPADPYKVAPADPGGMQVEGKGDSAFATSEGADPKGTIDVAKAPEAPLSKSAEAKAPAAPTPAAKAAPKQTAQAPAMRPEPKVDIRPGAAPAASGPGGTVQLGAFSSQASANAAWKALAGRFAYLAPLSQSVTATTTGGRTLYRLRASGPGAKNLCDRLRVAGESCVSID